MEILGFMKLSEVMLSQILLYHIVKQLLCLEPDEHCSLNRSNSSDESLQVSSVGNNAQTTVFVFKWQPVSIIIWFKLHSDLESRGRSAVVGLCLLLCRRVEPVLRSVESQSHTNTIEPKFKIHQIPNTRYQKYFPKYQVFPPEEGRVFRSVETKRVVSYYSWNRFSLVCAASLGCQPMVVSILLETKPPASNMSHITISNRYI